jgi:XTP/dITP diphosphohydrolase
VARLRDVTDELVLATRNPAKRDELLELLKPHGVRVRSLADFPQAPEVVEDGSTFAENAAKKATVVARALGLWSIGEDSGLEVDALDGAPGVYSARYSGADATDDANNSKLMKALQDVPDAERTARYVAHVAVAAPDGDVKLHVECCCRGRITDRRRGSNGFGYDPYFLIPEYHHTFGELSPIVKRCLSHRGRALRRLIAELLRLLSRPADKT